ncbi:hypothetical protein ES705_47396 [subsurface metagenome]
MYMRVPLRINVIEFKLKEPNAAGDQPLKIRTPTEFAKAIVEPVNLHVQRIVAVLQCQRDHLRIFLDF